MDFKVIFPHGKIIYTMIYIGITDTAGKINAFQCITKFKRARFGVYFIALPGFKSLVVALFCFFELAKNLVQRAFANRLFRFSSYFKRPIPFIFLQVTIIFQVFNKITNAIILIRKLMLSI